MTDPAQHPAHDFPLAERLVNNLIRKWLDTQLGIELAGYGEATPEERAARKAIDQVRHLALANYQYALTPKILDELKRADPAAALPAPDNQAADELAKQIGLRDYWHQEAMSATHRIIELETQAKELRRLASEAQQDEEREAPWASDSARIGRALIWSWSDVGKGEFGRGYRAAQEEARAILTRALAREAQQDPTQDGEFVPPAALGLPAGTLEAAEIGANRLDAWARTPYGRNFLAHALVQLARTGWLRTEPGEGFETVRDRDDIPEPQDPTQGGTCGAREPEPRTGTSPCVLPSGHGGSRHQDKWTNQWPITAVARPGQPETGSEAQS